MTPRRRGSRTEPLRCVCQPGPDAHHEHAKPGRRGVAHFDPRCPHWDPASSGVPQTPPKAKRKRLRRLDSP